MQQQSCQNHSNRINLVWIGLEILAVLALISLRLLLKDNMASNEADVLPLARQYADPNWIPGDWYLNLPPGYRVLFQTLFGRLIVSGGFLATSIAGRLICYTLVASGLVLIGRQLGLNLLVLLLAVSLFLSPNDYRSLAAQIGWLSGDSLKWFADALMFLAIGLMLAGKKLGMKLPFPLLLLAVSLFLRGDNGLSLTQGLAAGEWLVGGLEAKALAYGLVLLAIGLLLQRRYRLMALLLGLATSFHVLVGGYTFLTVLGWLVLRWKTRFPNLRELAWITLLYLVGSALAIKPVLEQLSSPTPAGALLPSFIYVFLVLPYHLNPLSWASDWWVNPVAYLLILAIAVSAIWLNRPKGELSEKYAARTGLFEFTLLSLVPFMLGLAVAPFDSQGRFLQYYPFRLGDIMLPLNTCLLFGCALQQTLTGRRSRPALLLVCILLLNVIEIPQFQIFQSEVQALRLLPSQQQGVDPEWKDFCDWVRNNTPKNATFVSPANGWHQFTRIAERPSIANRVLLPQTKAEIVAWYQRLRDLNGDFRRVSGTHFIRHLILGYNRLTTAQAVAIINKYQADYFVTRTEHRLDLPVAYRNQSYVLYKKPG